ncbi:hypothetical protein BaRGS_00002088 [Batillaria attramentaria]|uniref:Secreted protein n=1 Tax=Batillaria attramentaria TaxID=370345 RepID=A0ABD0M615_9CAEN
MYVCASLSFSFCWIYTGLHARKTSEAKDTLCATDKLVLLPYATQTLVVAKQKSNPAVRPLDRKKRNSHTDGDCRLSLVTETRQRLVDDCTQSAQTRLLKVPPSSSIIRHTHTRTPSLKQKLACCRGRSVACTVAGSTMLQLVVMLEPPPLRDLSLGHPSSCQQM